MKFFLNIALINAIVFSCNVYAEEESKQHDWATSVSTSGVFFRNEINTKHSIFYGVSYTISDSKRISNNITNHRIGVEIGHRYYLEKTSLHHFVDTSLAFIYYKDDISNDNKSYHLNVMYGLEKYLNKEFSIEGAAGFTASYYSDSSADYTSSHIAIPTIKLAVNYYF